MEDLKALRRKRKMKGDAVGRALLGMFVNSTQRMHDANVPVYMSSREMDDLVARITDPNEFRNYEYYAGMYYMLVGARERARENYNSSMHAARLFWHNLRLIKSYTDGIEALDSTPQIVSEDEREQIINEYWFGRDELLQALLPAFMYGDLEGTPDIEKAVERAKTTPAQEIPEGYWKDTHNGHWTLPDGTALEGCIDDNREILQNYFLQGRKLDGETNADALKRINDKRSYEMTRAYYMRDIDTRGIDPDEFYETVRQCCLFSAGISFLTEHTENPARIAVHEAFDIPIVPLEWVDEPAETPTVYDLMVFRIYPSDYVRAVEAYMNTIPHHVTSEGNPALDAFYYKDVRAAGMLVGQLDVMPYRNYGSTDHTHRRSNAVGCAFIDYDGYEPPKLDPIQIQPAPAIWVHEGLRYVYGYNAILGVLADVYGVPELAECRFDTSPLETYLSTYNDMLFTLYALIDCVGGDEIRKTMKEKCEPLDLDAQKPDPVKVEWLRNYLKHQGYSTRYAVMYIDGLLYYIR